MINQASGINKEFLFKHFSDNIIKKRDIIFEAAKSQFYQREYKTLWDLPIEEPNFSLATSTHVAEKLPDILTDNWASTLKKNENLHEWYQKIIFLRFHKALIPPHIQDELESLFDGDALKKSFCLTVFKQACFGESKMTLVLQKNLVYFFELNISETLRSILQTELPNRLKVPSGSMIPIHYSTVEHPFLRVRIQEVFGWEETPKILFQSVSVVLHLLGPNFRPVQVTSDLESFWKNGYSEIRKELRIRYPKHQWPLNPADGIAHAKGARRK
ncbi:Helicase [Legionella sainthelensi]|uniref:ATP-dependent helicase C-terminal domain-containing protein n=1 Tax=Legionella sainthelensi TaxID=28087 RepID=UPI000F6B81D1|nr:ATP-dependent helicase C-terminal domain-containing protein [Legionella sainthelensi]VEB35715.1 Helicase [Legionella sainthelensi]